MANPILDDHRPYLAAFTLGALFTVGAVFVGDTDPELATVDASGTDVSADAPPVGTVTTTPAPPVVSAVDGAGVTTPARRLGNAQQVTPTTIPGLASVPVGVAGDCESWRPLLDYFGIPFDEARPIMWRESRCDGFAHNGNGNTRDHSHGLFQVNRWGQLAAWWDSAGFTHDVMSTEVGAIAAAATFYHACGWGPWIKPYGCRNYQQTPSPTWEEWQS